MLKMKEYEFWFCTGSQDLYGDECLAHVAEHSKIIVEELNNSGSLPYKIVWKPTLITNELIRKTFNEANTDENMISNESPLGAALIGTAEGETVSVQAPVGEIRYQVLEIGKREGNKSDRDTESE